MLRGLSTDACARSILNADVLLAAVHPLCALRRNPLTLEESHRALTQLTQSATPRDHQRSKQSDTPPCAR
jgi:hypothetical protein